MISDGSASLSGMVRYSWKPGLFADFRNDDAVPSAELRQYVLTEEPDLLGKLG